MPCDAELYAGSPSCLGHDIDNLPKSDDEMLHRAGFYSDHSP